MRALLAILSVLSVVLAVSGSAWAAGVKPLNQLTPDEEKEGYVLLFDGKSLDNWVIMGKRKGFKVVDGVIRSEGRSGGRWMRTKRMYDNFILKVDWRVSKGGNSGVFIRAPEKGRTSRAGHEIQITNRPRDLRHCTGSLYGTVAVNARPDESPDKWHNFEIRCEGKKITVSVDGKKTTEGDMDVHERIRNKPMKGYIGLQDSHTSSGSWIEFRNIKIKELE